MSDSIARQVIEDNSRKKSGRKVLSEEETFQNVIRLARENGVEDKVRKIYSETYESLKLAKTEEQRMIIAKSAIVKIHTTIGCVSGLIVEGEVLLQPDPSYSEELSLVTGLSKA